MKNIIKDTDFKQWLVDLKLRIRQSQIKAMIKVNDEMLRLYWDLGHDIVVRQMDAWGSGFFEQLSRERKTEFPEMQGFSVANLRFAKRFYLFYSKDVPIRYQFANELQTSENKTDTILYQVGAKLKSKNNIDAQYSLESSNQPIGISEYSLAKLLPANFKSSLPSIEEIERELNKN